MLLDIGGSVMVHHVHPTFKINSMVYAFLTGVTSPFNVVNQSKLDRFLVVVQKIKIGEKKKQGRSLLL